MRHIVNEHGLSGEIDVDSAGTGGWHTGEPPHTGTRKRLTQAGISYDGIYARKLSREDIAKFDYIIGMDSENLRDIRSYCSQGTSSKTHLLADFVPDCSWKSGKDVPDPWYTGDFDETFELVHEGCEQLLAYLTRK